MINYVIASIQETQIMDVIEHKSFKEKKEDTPEYEK
jgi:hypothetical protein